MPQSLSGPRKASYALFILVLVGVARYELGPCLLSGLVSYMILDLTERRLRARGSRPLAARGVALAVFAIMAAGLAWVFVEFLRVGLARLPVLLDTVLPRLTALSEQYGLALPVDNARELRDLIVASVKENAASVGKTSGLLTRGFFQIVAGMFAAVMRFLSPSGAPGQTSLFDSLCVEFSARVALFVRSFERVVGAQVTISVANTFLTASFLHVMGFPFRSFLTLTTFVCGMLPIVGNVISNTIIVTAGLTVSVQLAMFGLAYLVLIHKVEYVLNSRIVGGSIDIPMWMTLLGLVVGEAAMGVPGVLLAPALLHYAREELRAIPAASMASEAALPRDNARSAA
ncbi:MAG: AI-2E family transporter [Elusimicrobia bacterium]|nr:AI-2E family transporter [Elusimicrobiota bacterium]